MREVEVMGSNPGIHTLDLFLLIIYYVCMASSPKLNHACSTWARIWIVNLRVSERSLSSTPHSLTWLFAPHAPSQIMASLSPTISNSRSDMKFTCSLCLSKGLSYISWEEGSHATLKYCHVGKIKKRKEARMGHHLYMTIRLRLPWNIISQVAHIIGYLRMNWM